MTRSVKTGAIIVAAALIVLGAAWSRAGNGVNLPNPRADESRPSVKGTETVVFAGGCFWGIQAVFEHVRGVARATAGYSGGTVKKSWVRRSQHRNHGTC